MKIWDVCGSIVNVYQNKRTLQTTGRWRLSEMIIYFSLVSTPASDGFLMLFCKVFWSNQVNYNISFVTYFVEVGDFTFTIETSFSLWGGMGLP